MDDGGLMCTSDLDCDDGDFCNGPERCSPRAPGASLLGCIEGARPCDASVCDELGDECVMTCSVDGDGDGARARRCGGTDCDDSDPTRSPTASEVCDPAGIDEDCDPTTFGTRDLDGDGFPDGACCNGDHCGEDCDDSNAEVSPAATERCNGTDDDCDGHVDETCATRT